MTYSLVFRPQAWEDYGYWQQHNRTQLKRLNRLIDDVLRDPTSGIGKPEQLKYGVDSAWSRRIDEEHRLVYQVIGDEVIVLQARFHYSR